MNVERSGIDRSALERDYRSEAMFWPMPDTVEPVFLRRESEDVSIAAGRLELSRTPLLASYRGTQPDLILRWNDMPAGSPVDVVVHLHGYSNDKLAMRLRNKELYSGLDFSNPDGSGTIGRTAGTLGIIPRGSYVGDQPQTNPETYTFPALVARDGILNLISYGIAQFSAQSGSGSAPSGRTILTAHSGGGYPLMPILAFNTPNEIHVFDALYWDASNLIAWLRNRIAAEIQAWTPGQLRAAGGLCVIYRPSGTQRQSLLVRDAIRSAIEHAPVDIQPALRASYRVLSTAVAHGEIPRRFGWRLLGDITADLSDGASAPSTEAILPGPRTSPIPSEDYGDGSNFVSKAVGQCWSDLQSLTKTLSQDDNPARASLLQIKSETGVAVDKNPYYGLTQGHLEAVIRAAFNTAQAPETLLALWAKEGSLKMETGSVQVSQASTAANARSIFRCTRFYVDLGSDTFLVTHYDPVRKDNVWDDSDGAASGHEARFLAQVKALVDGGFLGQDITAAVNAELTVSSALPFAVTASTKFFALSMLLMDALFARFQANTFSQLSSISNAMNYLQWNMGTEKYKTFLASAEKHRKETAYDKLSTGDAPSLEDWALHRPPKAAEYHQPRVNALRFMHYTNSYRPIFASSASLIKP